MIMHLQNGTFRRPGTEDTRIPHFLIVDEYSRYINPDVEIFLSLAAEYRVAGIFATQSLGQLEIESGNLGPKAMKQAILTSGRNKICFGGISAQDAQDFADEFGKDKVIMRQSTYKNRILLPRLFPDSYRDTEDEEYRFDPTDLMDGIPKFNYVHKLLQDGTPQKPALAKGQFVPRNWKELREWEDGMSFKTSMKNSLLSRFRKRTKMKKEQVAGIEQTKQEGPESPIEPIIQPELETLHPFELTPDISETKASLPNETKQEVEEKHIPKQKKESKEPIKTVVQQSQAVAERSSGTKIKEKETSNIVKSNDGFWD